MPYKINASGSSDTGLVRQTNEDAWGEVPELRFYVLADGMGGHQAGEVAAREAVASMCRQVKKMKKQMTLHEAISAFRHAVLHVNTQVFQLSRVDEHLKGMGTTLCCIQFRDQGAVYANVGDSRIYRLRNKVLEQLTTDHSLMRELMDLGQLSESQANDFLYKNILTKAVGTEPSVEPSIYTCDIADGDIFLMCSDGLSDPISHAELELLLNAAPTVEDAVKTLVATAKRKGGYDNITVVIIQIHESSKKAKMKDER